MLLSIPFSHLGSSTLPRATTRGTETELGRENKVPAATSSTSLYDNVASGNASGQTTAQGISTMNFNTFRIQNKNSRENSPVCF